MIFHHAGRITAFLLLLLLLLPALPVAAQELEARVVVNHQQIQGTSGSVFEALQTEVERLLGERQWTNYQFGRQERISCTLNITVTKYTESENLFAATLVVQSNRPVYGSDYTTTVFSTRDAQFNFVFSEFDKLEFRPDVIDNDLTALLAYYAYLIIGMDLDTYAPSGGTEVLEMARSVVTGAQSLTASAKGWKAFEDDKNRYAIINDYLDAGMAPLREMQYRYYREGLDVMAENAERGRAGITKALDENLRAARENKPMSLLPQIFTEFKRDELVGIYQGRGTGKDKERLCELLSSINASQNSYWNKMK